VPALPLMPVRLRLSEVTRPARSKAWLMEPAVPRLIDVGRLSSSYDSVSVRLDGKDCEARRPSSRYVRATLLPPTISGYARMWA